MTKLRDMSNKAIRMTARLLVRLQLGGSLVDTPDEFYSAWGKKTGMDLTAMKEELARRTGEEVQELVADRERFAQARNVVEFVRKRLGAGFHRKKHEAEPGAKPISRKMVDLPDPKKRRAINALLRELEKTKDQELKRRLRGKLRRLGHRGGITGYVPHDHMKGKLKPPVAEQVPIGNSPA